MRAVLVVLFGEGGGSLKGLRRRAASGVKIPSLRHLAENFHGAELISHRLFGLRKFIPLY